MAEKKLRSKFFEDILTKYNIVLSMKELTSASETGALRLLTCDWSIACLRSFLFVKFREIAIINDD